MIKKVLFAGNYDKEYNRTKVISVGLESLGIEIIHFVFKKHNNKTKSELLNLSKQVDIIFLPSFTHLDVKFVRKNITKPLIFDPLISKYLTKVFDFKQVSRYSPRAYKNYLKDKIAFKNSDIILADTEEHKKYFVEKFKITPNKIKILRIGVNCKDFFIDNSIQKEEKFTVGFYGGFIPLQGVQNILNAAKLLIDEKEIVFKLIGNGFEFEIAKNMVLKENISNVELLGWIDYKDLSNSINKFDVCLGIFGDTPKADIVIPNKVYHYAACKKPIITKNTLAIKEVFEDEKNIILSSSEPEDIAKSILKLKNDISLSEQISQNAFSLICNDFDTKSIAKNFIKFAESII